MRQGFLNLAMERTIDELEGLAVRVDAVVFTPSLDAPEERPYPFVYHLTIVNNSKETVTIRGRKWVVTDHDGHQVVVEGEGVVGQTPKIRPGQEFSYNSYHVVGSKSEAVGCLFGLTGAGEPVMTRIPKFTMEVPS